ncbi:MAG: hypothetical protein KDI38_08115 [Calditrichaeota bacterium]|nr:hypothetical protein [Calditrichota bacterium]
MKFHPGHFVALFGGACAGSEAAFQLANRGIYVAVFDQQALPYGKIEDGLPKWHVKLRDKEEAKIDQKLSHPNIFYVPQTKLGRDLQFEDIVQHWGFSAVLLASGAWRDRPLPVNGADDYLEKGLYYQNPFVEWFNHNHEPDYHHYAYDVADGAIVVGGGLASIDVVKILMLESTVRALAKRGITTNVLKLEHRGIPAALAEFGVNFSDLGLKGCTLYYRRRNIDMPLSSIPEGADADKLAKAQQVREKILTLAREKFCFHFQECCKPVGTIVENSRLNGLVFQKTRIAEGRVQSLPGTEFEVRSPLVISSIGSIPEPIPGIPSKGELFTISNEDTGQLDGYEHVFALGNAVTGRGNIRESELHSRKVIHHVMDHYLGWGEADYQRAEADGWDAVNRPNMLSESQVQSLYQRVEAMQRRVGYDGDYTSWSDRHQPVRLENMLGENGN